jgi:hypothetical protein
MSIAPRRRQASWGALVGFVALLCLSASAFAAIQDELTRLRATWPASQEPFSEWILSDVTERDGSLLLIVNHRQSGETASLQMMRRDDERSAYARTALYNLSYISDKPERHTSPELDRLLPAWVSWLDRIEGSRTALPSAEQAELLKKQRMERETQLRIEKETQARLNAQRVAKYGVSRLVASKGGKISGLSSEVLTPYLAALLVFCLVALFPRINAMTDAIRPEDESWFRRTFFWLLPPAAFTYGLNVAASLPPEVLVGIVPYPADGMPVLMVNLVTNLIVWLGTDLRLVALMGASLAAGAATLTLAVASYGLFWNRYAAGYTALFYMVARIVTASGPDPWGPLVADTAIAAACFGLVHQAFSKTNSWRLVLTAPLMTTAILFDPSYLALIGFYFGYLILESQDRERTFRYPLTWIVPLFILVFSLPALLLPAIERPDMTLFALFGSGWATLFSNIGANEHAGRLMPDVMMVFLVIGLIIHHQSMRKMVILVASSYVAVLLLSVGLANVTPVWVLTGQSLIFPALLAGVGMQTLATHTKAARSPLITALLIFLVIGFGALELF